MAGSNAFPGSILEGERNPFVNMQYLVDAILTELRKTRVFQAGIFGESGQETGLLGESKVGTYARRKCRSYFPSGAGASDMSSYVVSGEKLDPNMSLTSLSVRSAISSCPQRSIHIHTRLFFTTLRLAVRVLPKHDDLLTTHAARWP
jgi:hypothetical protein